MLRAQPWDMLRPLLEAAGCDVERALARLRAYATLLLEWNRGVSNLVSHNDERRLVERHLAESLAPAPLFASLKGGRLIDLGSGSGLPALPLAIAGIGARWTLVESRRNKTLFMRKAIEEIGLKGIDVNCARLETLLADGSIGRSFDGFTSRATMAVGPTLEMAGGCVVNGGRAFLWKGSGLEAEMAAAATELRASWTHEATLPILDTPNGVATFICNK